jgi:hypothetical protein
VKIAAEITALQAARLLHLMSHSNGDDNFREALEECVRSMEERVTERCVAHSCISQLLIFMCVHAHRLIAEGLMGAAVLAISGLILMFTTVSRLRIVVLLTIHLTLHISLPLEDVASSWIACHRGTHPDLTWAAG